ncbi:zinc-binding dehydrogenase [Sulfitobacter sp. EhC04]|uniref:NAD(P)-dependent alcohol dehydrogenase n=1 Tax=Sulfitobacter sp. EhC04 TaxID=1849168 RepID=UPI0007F4A8D2|nr:NAD(P)-dependent alcohol dehydrogenase [Sulfitobacter sp. EhC04]OAN75952.1 zinc-binding dehydrogenase [Sulfitobacter sp. EhC04]
MKVDAFGANGPDTPFAHLEIARRPLRPNDVQIEIAFCGICHTDLHQVRDWPNTRFPCVPGHEIVGHITAKGSAVTGFETGDTVGVGCIVDSCQECEACEAGLEQFCAKGFTGTYNAPTQDPPGYTMGGYSRSIVVDQDYVLAIRHSQQDLAAVAPLLCAGITTYSALKTWKVGTGQTIGVVGIGGLGHVGIRIARALGANVVAFTSSDSKRDEAARLGATDVVNSRDSGDVGRYTEKLDFILNTVAASHDLDPYIALLKRDCTMAMFGAPNKPHPAIDVRLLFRRRRSLSGSLLGGIRETQEMLDFCAKHEIVADIEMITAHQIDDAFDRLLRNDVKYRFVLNAKSLARDKDAL